MQKIKISTAQFENKSGDKEYNLSVIDKLSKSAAKKGAQAICFHECSITGYSFVRNLTQEELYDLAEPIPDKQVDLSTSYPKSPSTIRIAEIAKEYGIAGLFEIGKDNKIYKAFICIDPTGRIAKHRKLHPFINKAITPGNAYTIFNLLGWTCGILICYDNNIIENVRATSLLGADIIFMPHVTMCTPSPRPGAGFVDPKVWDNRHQDPEALRKEYDGPNGRSWLMKWLPTRAYDNGIFAIFSNPIGMDGDQVKNGCSMILDPFGDILVECRSLTDEIEIAELDPEKLTKAGGHRYKLARRPELYSEILSKPNQSTQKVAWVEDEKINKRENGEASIS